jgi:hypothetical protein
MTRDDKYNASPKGKARNKRYEKTRKARKRNRRYREKVKNPRAA